MKPTPFNADTDIAPIPFTDEVCHTAKLMKDNNLKWQPHVGCFVWDELELIEAPSPFPNRIYFILNLGHFLRTFQTIENIAEKLIWIPTCNQALQICDQLKIPREKVTSVFSEHDPYKSDILINLYKLIVKYL